MILHPPPAPGGESQSAAMAGAVLVSVLPSRGRVRRTYLPLVVVGVLLVPNPPSPPSTAGTAGQTEERQPLPTRFIHRLSLSHTHASRYKRTEKTRERDRMREEEAFCSIPPRPRRPPSVCPSTRSSGLTCAIWSVVLVGFARCVFGVKSEALP